MLSCLNVTCSLVKLNAYKLVSHNFKLALFIVHLVSLCSFLCACACVIWFDGLGGEDKRYAATLCLT